MWLDALRILGGGVCLYFGAEWLVGGASGLARALGMRPIVIGLTIVAFGTSAPELVVSALAAFDGKSAIALGNVVGSNIANIGLILGLTAIITPPLVESSLIRREVPVLVLAALAVPLVLLNDEVSRVEGVLLFLGAVGFTWLAIRSAKAAPADAREIADEAKQQAKSGSRPKLAALTVLGLGVLVLGGKLFVDGASGVASAFGISDRIIGLTVVAVGTSLPELAASVVAALRGHSAIAVGNVVGSNIYNVLFILGAAATTSPMAVPFSSMKIDLAVLVGMTLLGVVFLRQERKVTRGEGVVLALAYFSYIGYLVVSG